MNGFSFFCDGRSGRRAAGGQRVCGTGGTGGREVARRLSAFEVENGVGTTRRVQGVARDDAETHSCVESRGLRVLFVHIHASHSAMDRDVLHEFAPQTFSARGGRDEPRPAAPCRGRLRRHRSAGVARGRCAGGGAAAADSGDGRRVFPPVLPGVSDAEIPLACAGARDGGRAGVFCGGGAPLKRRKNPPFADRSVKSCKEFKNNLHFTEKRLTNPDFFRKLSSLRLHLKPNKIGCSAPGRKFFLPENGMPLPRPHCRERSLRPA